MDRADHPRIDGNADPWRRDARGGRSMGLLLLKGRPQQAWVGEVRGYGGHVAGEGGDFGGAFDR